MNKSSNNSYGFTLVEIMITLAISGIIMTAIYSAYLAQQRTYLAQEQVAEMQQNIRAALDMMEREIRMAGYDPTGKAGAGIVQATAGRINFTQDITDSAGATEGDGNLGDPNENITFGFSNAYDADSNGIVDTGAAPLGRDTGGGFQPIAENIQAIEFRYLDSAGAVTAVLADIRSVQISILARAGQPDRNFTNTATYTSASGVTWGSPYNDNFRRRLLITTIQCRNMGL